MDFNQIFNKHKGSHFPSIIRVIPTMVEASSPLSKKEMTEKIDPLTASNKRIVNDALWFLARPHHATLSSKELQSDTPINRDTDSLLSTISFSRGPAIPMFGTMKGILQSYGVQFDSLIKTALNRLNYDSEDDSHKKALSNVLINCFNLAVGKEGGLVDWFERVAQLANIDLANANPNYAKVKAEIQEKERAVAAERLQAKYKGILESLDKGKLSSDDHDELIKYLKSHSELLNLPIPGTTETRRDKLKDIVKSDLFGQLYSQLWIKSNSPPDFTEATKDLIESSSKIIEEVENSPLCKFLDLKVADLIKSRLKEQGESKLFENYLVILAYAHNIEGGKLETNYATLTEEEYQDVLDKLQTMYSQESLTPRDPEMIKVEEDLRKKYGTNLLPLLDTIYSNDEYADYRSDNAYRIRFLLYCEKAVISLKK